MTDSFVFYNQHLVLPLVIAGIILWAIFIWKELPVFGKIRFYIRIVIALVTIICISFIVLKPMDTGKENGNNALLITEHSDDAQVDSLKKEHKNLTLLNYRPNESIIPDSLFIDTMFITGNGLASYDFYQLEHTPVRFINTQLPGGISLLDYEKSQYQGDRLVLKGVYHKAKIGHRIILEGPAGVALDSVELEEQSLTPFELEADLNVAGKFLYHLVEQNTEALEVDRNPIPLKVLEKKPLKILLINAYPTFETKYLKNFLAEKGHQVLARTQLTRGRFKFEYFNLPKQPVNNLSQDELEEFDLIVIDHRSLLNLSSAEISALQTALTQQGLGLFIQPEESVFSADHELIPFDFEYSASNQASLNLGDNTSFDKFPLQIKEGFNLKPIFTMDREILSAYQRFGQGKIGTSVLSNSYQLVLDGENSVYQKIWTEIVENISKSSESTAELEAQQELIYVDEPLDFKLRTSLNNPVLNSGAGYQIPLKQNIDIPRLWYGRTYPTDTGWQSQKLEQDSISEFDYYVFEANTWKSLKSTGQIRANQAYFNNRRVDPISGKVNRPVNLFWYYFIALLGLGYLWLVPKLGNEIF